MLEQAKLEIKLATEKAMAEQEQAKLLFQELAKAKEDAAKMAKNLIEMTEETTKAKQEESKKLEISKKINEEALLEEKRRLEKVGSDHIIIINIYIDD